MIFLDAHKTIKICFEESKTVLQELDKYNDLIETKKRQLREAREELQELGLQESALKVKRDSTYAKCSELRKKLHASRDAVHYLQSLYGKRKKTTQQKVRAES